MIDRSLYWSDANLWLPQSFTVIPKKKPYVSLRPQKLKMHTTRRSMPANPALNLAPFGRWTLHEKAAQRRLALRYA